MRATGNGYGNACTIAIEEPTAVHGICRIAYEITSNKGTIRVKIEWKWRLGGEVDSRSPSTDMEYLLNEFGVDRKAFPRKYCQLEHGRFRGGYRSLLQSTIRLADTHTVSTLFVRDSFREREDKVLA